MPLGDRRPASNTAASGDPMDDGKEAPEEKWRTANNLTIMTIMFNKARTVVFAPGVRGVAAVAWPLLAGSAATLLLVVADTAILGHYDTGELSIMARAAVVFVFAGALLWPLGTAAQIIGAQWVGADDGVRVRRLLRIGLSVAVAAAGVMAGALALGAEPALALTGATASPLERERAEQVLRVLALALPAQAVSGIARGWLGAQGLTRIALYYGVTVNLSNVLLDLILVFGLRQGAVGSAWGTTAAAYLGAALCLVVAGRQRRRLGVAAPESAPAAVLKPWWMVAWPDIVFGAVSYGGDLLIVAAVGVLGATSLAGYRIVGSTVAVLFTVAFTCGTAATIVIGQRFGAKDADGVHAAARDGTIFLSLCTAVVALPVLILPGWYLALYTADPDVIAVTGPVLVVFWLVAPLIIVSISWAAVIRAVGDTRSMMLIGLGSQLVVAMPAAWLLGVASGHGLAGVVIGMALGWVTRTLLTRWRLRRVGALLAQLAAADRLDEAQATIEEEKAR